MTLTQLEIEVEPANGGTTVIRAVGKLDLSSPPQLRDALRSQIAGSQSLLLDLSGVTFTDSTAIRALVTTVDAAKVDGWDFGMRSDLQTPVRRAFEISGILPLLPLNDD
jgi:anti-sigma B factor antagonist